MSITSFLSLLGLSPVECQAVTRNLKEKYAIEKVKDFSQVASIDLCRKLGIPESRLHRIVFELVKEALPLNQSPSDLFAFSLAGPPPGRYPTNIGFLCNPRGFQFVSFGNDDFVPRFTRQVRDIHPSLPHKTLQRCHSTTLQLLQSQATVVLEELYSSENSIVYKAIFMPTLSFLALKVASYI